MRSSDPGSGTAWFTAGAIVVAASLGAALWLTAEAAIAGASGLPWMRLALPLLLLGAGDAAMIYGYTRRMPARA